MKGDILLNGNATTVKAYMLKKYATWSSWHWSVDKRNNMVVKYYDFASTDNQQVIRTSFADYFREPWPAEKLRQYQAIQKQKDDKWSNKVEFSEAVKMKKEHLAEMETTLLLLKDWKTGRGKVQEGEDFYLELKATVEPLIVGTFDRAMLRNENYVRGVSALTHSGSLTKSKAEGEFDFMAGMKAKTVTDFKFDQGLLQGAATLDGEMRAGVWGNGSVKAQIGKKGISAEAAMALAFGLEMKVDAATAWSINDFGVALKGNGRLFIGGEASASAKLKVGAKGFEASVQAGAFVGIKAECSGTISVQYMGGDMISQTATANISCGVGAQFAASIESTLFGPTVFAFAVDLAKGVGGGFSTSTAISFDRVGLAANAKFRDLLYLPTVLKGYSGELMNQERLNAHYLTKSIKCLEDEIESAKETLGSLKNLKQEEGPLLMDVS